jgi:hypothetical protein
LYIIVFGIELKAGVSACDMSSRIQHQERAEALD